MDPEPTISLLAGTAGARNKCPPTPPPPQPSRLVHQVQVPGGIIEDHTWLGHVAIAYAFCSPVVSYLWMIPLVVLPYGHWLANQEFGHLPWHFYILALLPTAFCGYLSVRAIAFGRIEHRVWMVVEGICALVIGIPLSLFAVLFFMLAVACG